MCELSTPMVLSQADSALSVLQCVLWYQLYVRKARWVRPQLHLDQRPVWPITCLRCHLWV